MNDDRLGAARKILGYVKDGASVKPIADAARRLIFLKGTNSHDYKYSSAVLEDYEHLSPEWRAQLLAASAFYLKSSEARENDLVERTRAALGV